ncbi:MAG: hypothetical protein IJI37_08200 [Opitutales bacterium]|nr:hypothetical protein [Opitutales bacterium]
MKKISIAIFSALIACHALFADAPKKAPRSYLVIGCSDGGMEIVEKPEGTALLFRTWGPEAERNFSVRAYSEISREKWTNVKFKLKTRSLEPLYMSLGGDRAKKADGSPEVFYLFDNIKINGKLVEGGDFESLDTPWRFTSEDKFPPRIFVIPEKLKFGRADLGRCAGLANSLARIGREQGVKKGEPFEVSFDVLEVDPKDAGDGDTPLDIRKYANMGFVDENPGDGVGGWLDGGKEQSFKKLARRAGDASFEGVRFKIIDPEKNSGSSVMTFASPVSGTALRSALFDFSKKPVFANYLYFLHSVAKTPKCSSGIFGYVVVIYEDGARVPNILRYGEDGADCWQPEDVGNGKIVLLSSKKKNRGALYMSRVKLDPKKFIKSIEFSSPARMGWVVAAATLSDKKVITCDIVSPEGDKSWIPADMPDDAVVKSGSALDFSGFWDGKPAGSRGRVIVSERGTMAFEKTPEKDARFKGFTFYPRWLVHQYKNGAFRNLDKKEAFENIEKCCAEMPKNGYNLVRMSFDWLKSDLKRAERAEQYDYVDYVIYQLKKNGVYLHQPLAWYDIGTKDYNFYKRNDVKIRAIFGEPEARGMWKETAEEQLNHYNPYTKLCWKDDPVFQVFEYYNELNICYNKWNEFEPATKELIRKRWREWLSKRYGGDISKLNAAWRGNYWARGVPFKSFDEIDGLSTGFEWEHFVSDANDEFMEFCRRVVRGTGYKGIVVQRNLGRTCRDAYTRQQISESIITNSYYQHPGGLYSPGADHTCGQASSIERELDYWRTIAATKSYNRPLTTTEYNHCYWNKWRHEMMAVFPSYSAFQNFSTLIIHSDAVEWRGRKNKKLSPFNVADSPAIRCSELFNQCFFMRGDVKLSPHRIDMLISKEYAMGRKGASSIGGGQMRIPLMTGFAMKCGAPNPEALKNVKPKPADLEIVPNGSSEIVTAGWFQNVVDSKNGDFNLGKFAAVLREKGILPKDNISDPENGVYQTDTGQIVIDAKARFAKTVSEYSCVAVVDKSREVDMGALKLVKTSVPAAVGAASLDGKKIPESSRLIFVYATQEDNLDSVRSKNGFLSIKEGKGPIVMKRGRVRAELKLDPSKKYAVYPIALNGERRERLEMEFKDGTMQINIDNGALKNGATAMFEIVAQ